MNYANLKQNAAQLMQQQQFTEALKACSKYCKNVKNDPEGLMLLGSIYGALGQFDNSINAFKSVLKLRSDIPQAFFNLGVAQQRSGDLNAALDSLLKALKLKPDFFEARFNLGEIYLGLDRSKESVECYENAAKLNQNYPPLFVNLGGALQQQGRLDEAIAAYLKAIKLAPNYVEAHVNLGMVYSEQKNYVNAEKAFTDAIAVNSNFASAHLQLGLLCCKKELYSESLKHINKSIEIDPNSGLSHYNLGVALAETGELDLAIKSYKRAIELTPDYINAYIALAKTYVKQGAFDEAIGTLNKALPFNPEKAEFYVELASVLGLVGGHAAAIGHLNKAITLSPDNSNTHALLGNELVTTNHYDEAIEAFERAVSLAKTDEEKENAVAGIAIIYERRKKYKESHELIKPYLEKQTGKKRINTRIALVLGNLSKKLNIEDQAIQIIESMLESDTNSNEAKIELGFKLGKTYDGLNLFDKAFKAYSNANVGYRKKGGLLISEYSVEQQKILFGKIQQVCTDDYFSTIQDSGCSSERPVFVVGMPRSGTTLTESIISSHPSAFGAGEMHDITEISKAVIAETKKQYPENMLEVNRELLDKLARHYLSRLDIKSKTAKRVVDKMPHNFTHLGLIALLFPKAKIIHIQRHPIDNCLSIYFQQFNISHAYASDLEHLGQYYRLYLDLMNHWNAVLPAPVLNIQYDELVSNQEAVTRQIIKFCGLEWDDRCLSFHASGRDVSTPSYDQVSQPMYTKSSGRWKNYRDHIGLLIRTLEKNGCLDGFEH